MPERGPGGRLKGAAASSLVPLGPGKDQQPRSAKLLVLLGFAGVRSTSKSSHLYLLRRANNFNGLTDKSFARLFVWQTHSKQQFVPGLTLTRDPAANSSEWLSENGPRRHHFHSGAAVGAGWLLRTSGIGPFPSRTCSNVSPLTHCRVCYVFPNTTAGKWP